MSTKKEPKELAKQFYTVMYRMRRFEEEVFEFYKRGLMPGLAHLYLGCLLYTSPSPRDCS